MLSFELDHTMEQYGLTWHEGLPFYAVLSLTQLIRRACDFIIVLTGVFFKDTENANAQWSHCLRTFIVRWFLGNPFGSDGRRSRTY